MERDISKKELLEKDIIANYLNILEILNQTTDDFLFLINLKTDTIWYLGNIDEKYALRENGAVKIPWQMLWKLFILPTVMLFPRILKKLQNVKKMCTTWNTVGLTVKDRQYG